jgi:lysophospholipase L1-like esterase
VVDRLAPVLLLSGASIVSLSDLVRTVVACLGDSITEGSPYWDSRERAGNYEAPWQHAAMLRYPQLELRNFGIWGQRVDEIAARFDEAVVGADALIVQGGINDIAQGLPIEPAADRLEALVARGLELGLPVAVCDVLPWNNGTPEQAAAILALNERIRSLGVPLLPFHDTLQDPEHPGRMKAEWTNADGDHPSLAGYRRLGERAFRFPFSI